jgi:hypothetical protein
MGTLREIGDRRPEIGIRRQEIIPTWCKNLLSPDSDLRSPVSQCMACLKLKNPITPKPRNCRIKKGRTA